MRALSLWQPWASLVIRGHKRNETRSWPCPKELWGQRIYIHAAKTKKALYLLDEDPFKQLGWPPNELPLGAILGYVTLVSSPAITIYDQRALSVHDPKEFAFGDYNPGRFAWVFRNVERFSTPIPYRGMQGLFRVEDGVEL